MDWTPRSDGILRIPGIQSIRKSIPPRHTVTLALNNPQIIDTVLYQNKITRKIDIGVLGGTLLA